MDIPFPDEPTHVIGIVGGAVAGSEAAALCAERGAIAIVLEQGDRPYGKIEDGLPRWHEKLRQQEYARIDKNLDRERVFFVPRTRVGENVTIDDLRSELGLSAILLANGAWRDRPLPVEGVEAYVDKGLVYQNPFVYWFNHYEEPHYDGPTYAVEDGAIVVGGGLASIDVVKIINLELYRRALADRGHQVDLVEMELKGIPATVEKLGLSVEELGVEGCSLFYRRRKQDMPLAPITGKDEKSRAKAEKATVKIMDRVMRKYLVRFTELATPVAPLVEGDRMVGLIFRKNRALEGRKLEPIEGSEFEVRSPLTVSSIGSVPEPLPGIPAKGELYDYLDWDTGELRDLPGVFGLGNVLTGKGNIRDSRSSSADVSSYVMAAYLGVGDPGNLVDIGGTLREKVEETTAAALDRKKMPPERFGAVRDFIAARWQAAGYPGHYAEWMKQHGVPILAVH